MLRRHKNHQHVEPNHQSDPSHGHNTASVHWTRDRFWDWWWHQSAPVSPMTKSSWTSFLNLSLTRSPPCSPIPVPSLTKSLSLLNLRVSPLFFLFCNIPSVISFLDRLKHKHYKGFTVTWPWRSWERKPFAEQLLNKSVIGFIILSIVVIVFTVAINTIVIIIIIIILMNNNPPLVWICWNNNSVSLIRVQTVSSIGLSHCSASGSCGSSWSHLREAE